MRAQMDLYEAKAYAKEVIAGQTMASLTELWRVLGFEISYNNSDLQCGPTPQIILRDGRWQCWEKTPHKLLKFLDEAGRRLRVCLKVSERLSHHPTRQATAIIVVERGGGIAGSAYRGDGEDDNMDHARFAAILEAFMKVLKDELL